jgi:hypothetical protein
MTPLGHTPFHWKDLVTRLAADSTSIEAVAAAVRSSPPSFHGTLPAPSSWFAAPRAAAAELVRLDVDPPDAAAGSWTVTASFSRELPERALVYVLWKPFASAHDWSRAPAAAQGNGYAATVQGTGKGAMFAIEVLGALGEGWRYPDVLRETPYRTVAP